MTTFPKVGDTGKVQGEDWILYGRSELRDKIKVLPYLDNTLYYRDQYVHARHKTSCTKFAYYNQWCTIFNNEGSWEEIDKVEATSKEMGWEGPGYGRSSSLGADAVRKTLGKVSKRQVTLFSEEWYMLKNVQRPVGISIIVDSTFWKDVKDGELSGTDFEEKYGHATTIQSKKGGYEVLDSVHKYRYTITEEQLVALVDSKNVRSYGYVLLPNDVFDVPNTYTEDEVRIMLNDYLLNNPRKKILRDIMDRNRPEPQREKMLYFLSLYK